MNKDQMDNKHIDQLLRSDLLLAPDDFTQKIQKEIEKSECLLEAPSVNSRRNPKVDWWQWPVVVGGSLIGIGQIATFIFGFWVTTTTG